MWDSGASDSYIDHDASLNFADQTYSHLKPIQLRLFDGSPASAGPITSYVSLDLRLTSDGQPYSTVLNITKLQGSDIVLGTNWMSKNGIVTDHSRSIITYAQSLKIPDTAMLLQALPGTPKSRSSAATYPNNVPLGHPSKYSDDKLKSPYLVEMATLRALAVVTEDELTDFKTIEPQFDEDITDAEYAAETVELLRDVPSLYHDYLDVFRKKAGTETLPPCRDYDMHIDLISTARLSPAKLYQLTQEQSTILKDTLRRELAAGRIRSSNAAYGSPTFFVPKKDGRSRMVVDYRRLNEQTIPDAYPLPLIDQITNDLSSAKYFTKLDLVGAYQLLRMTPGHEHFTAFRTQYGMFESLVVRDGLRNAPAYFQHFLNDVFRDILGRGVIIYIDDILIYADRTDELRRLTLLVFDIIRKARLYLKASKCEFEDFNGVPWIRYLRTRC